ncbi:MAG: FeoA family protein [Candidatus Methanomethylicia archaeon]
MVVNAPWRFKIMGYDMDLVERLMPKILETIYSMTLSGIQPTIDLISKKLSIPPLFVNEVLKLALNKGLISGDNLSLTEAGRDFVLNYRQTFIHDKLIHGKYDLENISSGVVHEHLKYSHGLDDDEINSLKDFLSKFDGNVEEAEPLTNLRPGERGVFMYAMGGYGILRRLSDMGLTPGIELEVLSAGPFGGPFILRVRGYEIVIGRGIASRIYVKRLK